MAEGGRSASRDDFGAEEVRISGMDQETPGTFAFPGPAGRARAAVLGRGAIFGIIAVATVASANYLSNATFGLWSDHLGLFLATIAASSIAGGLAALGLWNLRKPLT
jgi:hypothetical protein